MPVLVIAQGPLIMEEEKLIEETRIKREKRVVDLIEDNFFTLASLIKGLL